MGEEKMGGWRRTLGDVAEFQCFVCKDAGDVRVCDFRNCLKSYHPGCVGKPDDFIDSSDRYVCDWHKCAKSRSDALYLCLCCPSSSTCGVCFGKVDFVPVKQSKEISVGFCRSCFNMAAATEKDDHEELMVVFGGAPENYKILFKDYWTLLNDKEHFTLLDLQTANIRHKRSLKCKEGNDLDKYHKPLGDNDCAGPSSLLDTMDKPNEVQATMKRKKLEKKTYVGWGSKELTEFLSCIGKDTSTPLDHFKVTEVVKQYVRQKNLLHDKKKKSVMKFKYNMIHSLLETHLSANAISEDESDRSPRNSLEPKIPKSVSGTDQLIPKSVSGLKKKCLAALNQNNLNLIYLRRTLVIKLLTELDTFEQKVIGSLVRVRNDLKSYTYQMTKKYYQIGLVTGYITDILLCVSSMWDDVKISMLSEEDFEEDECNDLLLSAKKELFKRPTVAELEEKEASVHADIVNHWFDKQLAKLGKELERAHVEEENKETEIESAAMNPFQGNRGVTQTVADPLEVGIDQSLEGASLQHDAACEVAFEAAGKALCNGGTPGPGLHTPSNTVAGVIDIDNEEYVNGPSHHNGSDEQNIIDLVSDDDEDQREPERAKCGGPEADNGIAAHAHDGPEAVNGLTIPTVRVSDYLDGITGLPDTSQAMARDPVTVNGMASQIKGGFTWILRGKSMGHSQWLECGSGSNSGTSLRTSACGKQGNHGGGEPSCL
ncbi:hypothetical protein ZWY2020_010597 [Hordeum vulgare]|nr:hypothetical protein ZWY2020_010597 [Hordeum vulgare]